ncbi:transposase [Kribbella sp. VKM Ac-2568]|uniref:transposase n=1 Tax=Kribbella sp. VKM Ac-2568 TaxID=2512219 RepID=UPI003519FA4A
MREQPHRRRPRPAHRAGQTPRPDPGRDHQPHQRTTTGQHHRDRTNATPAPNPQAHQAYKRRGATVETVIGHLKDLIGLRTFSRRGLQAATSELHLAAAATNILKLHRTTTCTT